MGGGSRKNDEAHFRGGISLLFFAWFFRRVQEEVRACERGVPSTDSQVFPLPRSAGRAGKVYTYTHTMQLLPLPQAKPGVTSRREKRKSGSSSFPSPPFLPPSFPFRAICLRAIRKEDETRRRRRRRRPPYTPHRRSFLFRLTKAPGIRSGNNCPASWKKGGEKQIKASRIANSVAGSYRPLPHSKRAEAHL